MDELEENTNIDGSKINSTLSSVHKSISLDTPINNEDSSSLLDILPNNWSEPTDKMVTENDMTSIFEEIFSKMPYREADILRMSFGIGMKQMPNEQIANRFGIGTERVRQILHKAMRYIKNNFSKELNDLI